MKILSWFVLMAAAIFLLSYNNPAFAAETKRVCVQQVDPKSKKSREVCRQVKSHKKLPTKTKPGKKAK